jgi:LysM repeat protein
MSISFSTASEFGFAGSARAVKPAVTKPVTKRSSAKLRMTRRGRAVLLAVVCAPLVAGALFVGIGSGGATASNSSTPLTVVTVSSGETLWQLAGKIAPNSDPRDVISDVMNVNQLTSSDLYPGEQLKVPAQYAR